MTVFVAHSARDRFFTRALADRLREHGVRAWVDEGEIGIGEALGEKLAPLLDKADYFLVVLSHNSLTSEWMGSELRSTVESELPTRHVPAAALLLEPVEVPDFLRDRYSVDFTTADRFELSFPQLLSAMGANLEARTGSVPGAEAPEPHPAGFEDIHLVGLDEERSYQPDPVRPEYNVHLRLSSAPPAEWQQIFEAERRFPRRAGERSAWIEGRDVVVHASPEELEPRHLAELTADVERANAEFREYLAGQVTDELRAMRRRKEEREQLKQLKRRLNI